MITIVDIPRSPTSSSDAAKLIADYAAFDRQRTARRQYMKAFGGMAIIVLLGAAAGRVPAGEAIVVAGLLGLPPLAFRLVEAIRWRRLTRRLSEHRTRTVEVPNSEPRPSNPHA